MHSSGILLHISSLPGKYGIGTLGEEARKFRSTGFGDSPYQSYSAYAGNPLLIDIDMLIDEGLVSEDDSDLKVIEKKHSFTDYAQLYSFKYIVLKKESKKKPLMAFAAETASGSTTTLCLPLLRNASRALCGPNGRTIYVSAGRTLWTGTAKCWLRK